MKKLKMKSRYGAGVFTLTPFGKLTQALFFLNNLFLFLHISLDSWLCYREKANFACMVYFLEYTAKILSLEAKLEGKTYFLHCIPVL